MKRSILSCLVFLFSMCVAASYALAIPPVVNVDVDIKPGSCPNPINTKSKGVLSVAILGTDDFDVTQVDPPTVLLEGIYPLRWALEDVATPYEVRDCDIYACIEDGSDGYLDLTLKYENQEVMAALGPVSDGDCLILELTGELFHGTPFAGEDVVFILNNIKE